MDDSEERGSFLSSEDAAQNIDSVFAQIGFGRWQLIQMAAAMLSYAALAPGLIGSTLTNAPIAYRCGDDDIYESSRPFDNECHYKYYDSDNATFHNESGTANVSVSCSQPTLASSYNGTASAMIIESNTSSPPCVAWEYDNTVFTSTVSMEVN
ncbi:uncharacterized protein LOC135209976 [Macrobrachium nipponense]|uniref:uncharacterized protein LOC135209976 n=1 Tax=Macrobrachium nipponense TaxID=159736 RepID=UPI0030C7CF87